MTSTPKLDIATELLHTALRLYFEEGSDFATINLAGAAEELLGKHLEVHGMESSFASLRDSAVRLSRHIYKDGSESKPRDIANILNGPKNSSKHMNGADDDAVSFNPRIQARDLLDRAVSNYYSLMERYELVETELVRRFHLEIVRV
jgi:hypothetical protein